MKSRIILFLFLMSATFTLSAQTTAKKVMPPFLKYHNFQDTIVAGHDNVIYVLNVKDLTILMQATGCIVTRADGTQAFNVKASPELAGKETDVVVYKKTATGREEILRKKVKIVAATPALVGRMK